MSVGATLAASLLAVLDRPSTWPLALAGFLIRGGWLLVVAPIVVVPTAGGLANVLAPLLEDVAFGRRTSELIGSILVAAGAVVVWIVGGGLIAAVAEAEGVRRVAGERGTAGGGAGLAADSGRAWRILAIRLAAYVPFLIALFWGSWRVVTVGYRELTAPSDVTLPLPWRIAIGAPDAIIAVALTWLFGETVGAMGARRTILLGERARDALRRATGRFTRAPRRCLLLAGISSLVLAVVVGLSGVAVGTAWDGLRSAFARGDTSVGTVALLVVFVALFAGGLVLIGLTTAWRSAIWTLEGTAEADGTFG